MIVSTRYKILKLSNDFNLQDSIADLDNGCRNNPVRVDSVVWRNCASSYIVMYVYYFNHLSRVTYEEQKTSLQDGQSLSWKYKFSTYTCSGETPFSKETVTFNNAGAGRFDASSAYYRAYDQRKSIEKNVFDVENDVFLRALKKIVSSIFFCRILCTVLRLRIDAKELREVSVDLRKIVAWRKDNGDEKLEKKVPPLHVRFFRRSGEPADTTVLQSAARPIVLPSPFSW